MTLNASDIVKLLGLQELPEEGGFFSRTYQAKDRLVLDRGERAIGDAIYYLITPDQFSGLHKLKCDEMWHFYMGDPVEMLLFDETEFKLIEIGNSDLKKHRPQQLVKAEQWQGTKLKAGGKWALIGTNAFPGYDHQDFNLGKLEMFKNYPFEQLEIIRRYAR
jgi:predicted cupin superfamily sugar epimerase